MQDTKLVFDEILHHDALTWVSQVYIKNVLEMAPALHCKSVVCEHSNSLPTWCILPVCIYYITYKYLPTSVWS